MVGYQMLSMSNDNSRYGESALTNKSFYIEEQDHKPRASEVLDPGAHLWKSNNIWGNGDFSSRIFGRKHREPLAVTESNTSSFFHSPESLTSYGSLINSSEAESRSCLSRNNNGASLRNNARLALHDVVRPDFNELPLQNGNTYATLSNRDLSRSPDPFRRHQSLGRAPSRAPSLITNKFANPPQRANVSPISSADTAISPWTEQVSPSDSRASVSNLPDCMSRPTSYSGSLPPSRQGNDSATLAPSFDIFAQSRQGSRSAINTPFVTLTEPTNTSNADYIPTLQRLSIGHDERASILSMEPNEVQNSYPETLDQMFAFQGQNTVRRVATLPHSFSTDQGSKLRDGVLPHQFLGHQASQRYTYPIEQRSDRSESSAIQQASFYRQVKPSSLVENNPYNIRNDPQHGSLVNSRPPTVARDLGGLQKQHYLLGSQMQNLVNTAQARSQTNSSHFGNGNGPVTSRYAQSPSVSPFRPALHMYDPLFANRDQDSCSAVRSTLMQEFKSNYRTNKRYELKDIFNHVAEFSGDQHGSRFIQQKLENATSDEKQRVFQEIQPNTMQLTCDVFGNYVIQKFFEHGDQNQKKTLANRMKGHVLNLSLQTYACRVVQKALEHILVDQQVALIKELEHHVIRCVKDQNGNHVIQKAIERLPAEHIQFIIDAFAGQVQNLAVHSYGCRVIQRLIERAHETAKKAIMQELHACVPALISDQFGNYVIQHMIEYGGPKDRAIIINMIHNHLVSFATHKFASNVVEQGLIYASDKQRHGMLNQLLGKNDRGDSAIGNLIQCGYGNYVLQKFLDTLNRADYAVLAEALQPELQKAKRMNAGTGVKNIPAIEKKMRRFDAPTLCPRDASYTPGNISIFSSSNEATLPSAVYAYNNISVEAA